MAKVDKATFSAAMVLAVAQLNAAFADTITAGAAYDWRFPSNPLRNINNLFVQGDDGAFTVNTALIDAYYDQGNPLNVPNTTNKVWDVISTP